VLPRNLLERRQHEIDQWWFGYVRSMFVNSPTVGGAVADESLAGCSSSDES
jgi:hypothetical protein